MTPGLVWGMNLKCPWITFGVKNPCGMTFPEHFLGLVNYYRDVVKQRSDISAPLTRLTSTKVPFKWTKVEDEAFHKLNSAMGKETMLNYPNFSKDLKFHLMLVTNNLGQS